MICEPCAIFCVILLLQHNCQEAITTVMMPELRDSAIQPCDALRPYANASGCKLITESADSGVHYMGEQG